MNAQLISVFCLVALDPCDTAHTGNQAPSSIKPVSTLIEESVKEDFNGATYTVVSKPRLSQADAIRSCARYGSELTTVKSLCEFNSLQALIKKSGISGQSWHVNGGKVASGSAQVWLDDNSLIQSSFYGGSYPSFQPDANCVTIGDQRDQSIVGNNTVCDNQLSYICKKKKTACSTCINKKQYCAQFCDDLTESPEKVDSETKSYCADQCKKAPTMNYDSEFAGKFVQESFEGRLYTYVTGVKLTWNEAVAACSRQGGFLTSAKTRKEFDFLISWIVKPGVGTGSVWVGGSDLKTNGKFEWIEDTETVESLACKSGKTVGTFIWGKGEPNNAGENEHCTHIWDLIMATNDHNCEDKKSFICKN